MKELIVVHFMRPIALEDQGRFEFCKKRLATSFQLETCQRQIFVQLEDCETVRDLTSAGVHFYSGEKAYGFLLRLSCGLESALKGETDIFGQLKTAWKGYYPDSGKQDLVARVLQSVFEDTKEIRHQYIQNRGGQSYGSLVRLWMKKTESKPSAGPESVLLYGTGLLARSVFPFLFDSPLVLANRTESSLKSFFKEVLNHPSADPSKVAAALTPESAFRALENATSVVFCIPITANDDVIVSQLLNREVPCEVIHLGIRRGEEGAWSRLIGRGLSTLDDLLELQKEQGEMRSIGFKKAEMVCAERAKHRSLGLSLSTPHGWEDLAIFS